MKVWELLDCKDKWTTGAYARDKDEEPVVQGSTDAVKWCLTGAIYKCYPLEKSKIIEEAVGINIVTFNDRYSYEKVMKVIKELDI